MSAARINANNCPERLKHYLFGINEILEGRGEKIRKDVENEKPSVDATSSEYMGQMSSLFTNTYTSAKDEIETEKSLKEVGSKFGSGSVEQGKQFFGQISQEIASRHGEFHFFPQKGEAVGKELVLIHNSAQIGFDGSVLGDNQPVYLAQRFNSQEIGQIKEALGISQTFSRLISIVAIGGGIYYFATKNKNSDTSSTSDIEKKVQQIQKKLSQIKEELNEPENFTEAVEFGGELILLEGELNNISQFNSWEQEQIIQKVEKFIEEVEKELKDKNKSISSTFKLINSDKSGYHLFESNKGETIKVYISKEHPFIKGKETNEKELEISYIGVKEPSIVHFGGDNYVFSYSSEGKEK
ncbi:16572_t:CDS:2 [Funneliformis geosporum]|nr:16572_t:CDS:2 [Funneliformis geosporum]